MNNNVPIKKLNLLAHAENQLKNPLINLNVHMSNVHIKQIAMPWDYFFFGTAFSAIVFAVATDNNFILQAEQAV